MFVSATVGNTRQAKDSAPKDIKKKPASAKGWLFPLEGIMQEEQSLAAVAASMEDVKTRGNVLYRLTTLRSASMQRPK